MPTLPDPPFSCLSSQHHAGHVPSCPLKANPSLHLAGSDSPPLSLLSVPHCLSLCVSTGPFEFPFRFCSVIHHPSLAQPLALHAPVSAAVLFLLVSLFLTSLDIFFVSWYLTVEGAGICMCTCLYVCTCVDRGSGDTVCLSELLSTLDFDTGLSLNQELDDSGRQASQRAHIFLSLPPYLPRDYECTSLCHDF